MTRRRLTILAVFTLLVGTAPAREASRLTVAPEEAESSGLCSAEERLEAVRCLIDEGRYGEAETQARGLLEWVEARSGESSLEAARVLDLLLQALWRGGKAEDPECLGLAGRALNIKQTMLGTDHEEVADSLVELGHVLAARADYEKARSQFLRALDIYERELGPEDPKTAIALSNLAGLLRTLGEFEEARILAAEAVAILEQNHGPDAPSVASALESLAITIAEGALDGDYISLYRRSLTIREQAYGPSHPAVANSLHNLGWELFTLGEWEESKLLMERALEIREKVYGPESAAVADALGNYAILLQSMGYGEAFSVWERALELSRRSLGPNHPSVGTILANLALAVQGAGDYGRARRLYGEALGVFEAAFGPEHPRVGWTLNLLGGLLADLGDHDEAALLQQRALEILEPLGSHHWLLPAVLTNIGVNHERRGRYSEARKAYERALAIGESADGRDEPDVEVLLRLASLERLTGNPEAARELYERTLAIRSETFGAGDLRVTESLLGLAHLADDRGDYSEAQSLYEKALAVQKQELDPDHPAIASSLRDLAMSLLRDNRVEDAFRSALAAAEISRTHLRVTARSLGEREALRYASVERTSLDLLVSLALELESADSVAAAYSALIRSRALVLDELAERHRAIAGETDPEIARLADELGSERRRLANLHLRDPDPAHLASHRRMLEQARRRKESSERALAERSLSFRQDSVKAEAGLEEIAAALPGGGALVSFARFERHGLKHNGEGGPRAPEPAAWYGAFVLPRQGHQPRLVPLRPAAEIEALVEGLRKQISLVARAPGRSPQRVEAGYRRIGEELRAKIWDPLRTHLGEVASVFVVPDGALNLLQIEALPIGTSEYLIDREPHFHYLSAERDLLPVEDVRPGIGLLALGDPSFDLPRPTDPSVSERGFPAGLGPRLDARQRAFRGTRSSCTGFRSMRFDRLPESAREVRDVAALWTAAAEHRGRSGPRLRGPREPHAQAITLVGPDAGEAVFKELAPGRRILHLATHGFFLGGRCPSALASVERGSAGKNALPITGENPLLLAGLALAGANARETRSPAEEDGILTAEEIGSLDLSGTEWVVLSACDSGIGEVTAGEGVMGLRRAFRVAGAGTVIMSLWPVEDDASRGWMTALYEQRFLQGAETPDAVRRASLGLLERRRIAGQSTHPFFWAGFVAEGEWR